MAFTSGWPAPPLARPRRARLLLGLFSVVLVAGCQTAREPSRKPEPPKAAPQRPPAIRPPAEKPPAPAPPAEKTEDRASLNLKVFDAVWNRVRDEYYDPALRGVAWNAAFDRYRVQAAGASTDRDLYRIINDMLALLDDPDTRVVARNDSPLAVRGVCHSLGLAHELVGGRPVVTDVEAGGAAEGAGVKLGWIVVSADGRPFEPDLLEDLAAEKEQVEIEFLDQYDRRVEVTIDLRRKADLARGEARVLPGGEVYVKLAGCADDEAASAWLQEQCRAHRTAPALILDLRTCTGGGEEEVKTMGALLLGPRVDLGTVSRDRALRKITTNAVGGQSRYEGRVLALIGPGTAGGAELLAAALKDRERATLVGRRTAGAVHRLQQFKLPDGGAFVCRVGDYHTVHGESVERNGVNPDIEVALERTSLLAGEDLDLETAVTALQDATAEKK
jgi:carboxyl-terminal processing protease